MYTTSESKLALVSVSGPCGSILAIIHTIFAGSSCADSLNVSIPISLCYNTLLLGEYTAYVALCQQGRSLAFSCFLKILLKGWGENRVFKILCFQFQ